MTMPYSSGRASRKISRSIFVLQENNGIIVRIVISTRCPSKKGPVVQNCLRSPASNLKFSRCFATSPLGNLWLAVPIVPIMVCSDLFMSHEQRGRLRISPSLPVPELFLPGRPICAKEELAEKTIKRKRRRYFILLVYAERAYTGI